MSDRLEECKRAIDAMIFYNEMLPEDENMLYWLLKQAEQVQGSINRVLDSGNHNYKVGDWVIYVYAGKEHVGKITDIISGIYEVNKHDKTSHITRYATDVEIDLHNRLKTLEGKLNSRNIVQFLGDNDA